MRHWILFNLFILVLLAIDLLVVHKKAKAASIKEGVLWSCFWIALALGFNYFIYLTRGSEAALQFFTGYLLEKSLSVDNLFVFLLIFSYFKVPEKYQRKVLFWGICGALVMRLAFILAGVALLQRWEWLIYLLGGFLAVTGVRLLLQREKKIAPEQSWLIALLRPILHLKKKGDEGRFFIVTKRGFFVTPLFLVLLAIESSDIIFAIDSIPAILAITTDPYIVYTSNVFAMLGLRSLFLVLSHSMNRFHYFKIGISAILIFVGCKMLLSPIYEIGVGWSLAVIIAILSTALLCSLAKKKSSGLPLQ